MKFRDYNISFWLALILSLGSFAIYISTGAVDVYPGANHGELTSVAVCLGIAHPTGYPLWSLIGMLGKFIPLGNIPFRIHVIAATINTLVLCVFFYFLQYMKCDIYSSISAILMLAWEPLFWKQATACEIYGLHMLLMTLFIFSLHKASVTNKNKLFYLSILIFSLCIANHLISVFMIPLFIIPFISFYHSKIYPRFIIAIVVFLLGTSIYIYLPIRSLQLPLVQWHDPSNFNRFIEHVSGKEFQDLMFHIKLNDILRRIRKFFIELLIMPRPFLLILSMFGLFRYFRSNRMHSKIYVVFILLTAIFTISYAIHDIDAYVLPLIWVGIFFSAHGLTFFTEKITVNYKKRWLLRFAPIIGLMSLITHFDSMNRQDNHLLRNYGLLMLRSCPPDSYLLFQGDNPMNALSYLLTVEHRRHDIRLSDMNKNLKPIGNYPKLKQNIPLAVTFRHLEMMQSFYPRGLVFIQKKRPLWKNIQEDIISLFEFYPLQNSNESYCREIYSDYFTKRAEFEEEYGQSIKGKVFYEKAIGWANMNPSLLQYIAIRMIKRSYLQSAILHEKSFLEDFSVKDASFYNNYAFHLYYKGDLTGALNYSYRAINIDPQNDDYQKTYLKIILAMHGALTQDNFEEFSKFPDILRELEFLKKMRATYYPSKELSIPELAKDSDFARYFLKICLKNDIWYHSRLIAQNLFLNSQKDESLITDFAKSCIKAKCIPAGLFVLEKEWSSNHDSYICEQLAYLHKLSGNIARYKELLMQNVSEKCPDNGQSVQLSEITYN